MLDLMRYQYHFCLQKLSLQKLKGKTQDLPKSVFKLLKKEIKHVFKYPLGFMIYKD